MMAEAEAEAEAEKKPVEAADADAEGPVSKGANDGWGIGMMVDPGFARLDDDEQDALARQQNSVGGEADFEGNQWFQIGADDEAEGDASQGQGQGVPMPAVTGVRPGGLLDSIFGEYCSSCVQLLVHSSWCTNVSSPWV